MNPLLLTITFLTLMGLLTSSEMMHVVEEGIKGAAYNTYLSLSEKSEKQIATSAFEELQTEDAPFTPTGKKKETDKTKYSGKSAPLNYDHARPPNNSRLNLYLLMSDAHPEAHSLYETTASLLRTLYSQHPFFQEVPRAEYALLNTLIDYQEQAQKFFFADELGSLQFKDKQLQHLFYRMLKGSPDYPSVLHFVTYDSDCNKNQRKMNFMFAPQEVLESIIHDPACIDKLLTFRNALWDQIDTQENNREKLFKEEVKNRSYFKSLLTEYFKEVADSEFYQLFDFSLGKKGSVIYIEDSISGIVAREKIMKKRL